MSKGLQVSTVHWTQTTALDLPGLSLFHIKVSSPLPEINLSSWAGCMTCLTALHLFLHAGGHRDKYGPWHQAPKGLRAPETGDPFFQEYESGYRIVEQCRRRKRDVIIIIYFYRIRVWLNILYKSTVVDFLYVVADCLKKEPQDLEDLEIQWSVQPRGGLSTQEKKLKQIKNGN